METPLLYGKYQLLELVGRGGMAEVYKAKSHGVEGFEKLVVIKRILPEYSGNPLFVEMFIQEAKVAVTLSHANIVQVFDLGCADDSYFIAMEYVSGIDVAELLSWTLARGPGLPVALAVYVASEVAKGLDYAHRRRDAELRSLGVVHRDISPQNVLVSSEGEVKIADFGIARALGVVGQQGPALKGKVAYMAPEQARGEDVDHRADLFSLGVVLYQMLVGRSPWEGGLSAALAKEGGPDPEWRTALASRVPPDLVDIVVRSLSCHPDDRQSDAGRLYEELLSFLYAAGSRVGSSDLATFLQELGHERGGRAGFVEPELAAPGLDQGALPDGVLSATSRTPVEVPADRKPALTEEQAPWQPMHLWEVSALAWEVFEGSVLASEASELETIIGSEGGRIVERQPDFAVALFGLDQRDGRDTELAVHCALRLLRLTQTSRLQGDSDRCFGLAVHTGQILVSTGEQANPQEDARYFGLVDRARQLAARGPRVVTVSQEASRECQELFRLRGVEKGAWVVEGERPLAEVYGRFVGRQDTLRQVGEQLALAHRGTGSVLVIQGEPGNGKTRLLHETRRRLAAGGHDFNWYQVRCAPSLCDVPFAGLTQMVRALLAIDETDPAAKVKEQVDRLRELGLGPDQLQAVSVLLGLSPARPAAGTVPLDRELRVVLLHIATKLADDRLTLLVWDGADALDHQSIEALAVLGQGINWARVLVVLTCRSPLGPSWQTVPVGRVVELGPLDEETTAAMIRARLHVEEVPPSLLREVRQKTGGHPLYVEEYLKALSGAGALEVKAGSVELKSDRETLEIPKSLRGLLEAHVQRLDGPLVGVLQHAAVLSPQLSLELLSSVSHLDGVETAEAVARLVHEGILVEVGADEIAFANDLLRDVVCSGINFADRRKIHRCIAEKLETLHAGKLDEVCERLAVHFRESGQREQAVAYLARAGEKRLADGEPQAALQHFSRALELAQSTFRPDHARILLLYQRLGESAVQAGETARSIEQMRLGLELAEEVHDKQAEVALLTLLGRLHGKAGRLGEAQPFFARALLLSRELSSDVARSGILGAMGEALSRVGDYKQASELLEEALELVRARGDWRREIDYWCELALCAAARGQVERAQECVEQAKTAAAAHHDHYYQCVTFKFQGLVAYMVHDEGAALEAFSRALELAKSLGYAYESAVNGHNIGDLLVRQGEFGRAFTALRLSLEEARCHGFSKLERLNEMLLGFLDAVTLDSKEGLERIEEVRRSSQREGLTWDTIQATYYLGKACLHQGEIDRAQAALRDVILLAQATESRFYVEDSQELLASIEAGTEG